METVGEVGASSEIGLEVEKEQKPSTVLGAASIIAGTSIGGGFLALPFATAPAGFAPSALALCASWVFLVSCGLALTEVTLARMQKLELEPTETTSYWPPTTYAFHVYKAAEENENQEVSVFSVAEEAGGKSLALAAGLLFSLRCLFTLSAQASKAGVLLGNAVPMLPYPVAVLLPMSFVGLATFSLRDRTLDKINTFLTGGLVASFGVLVISGLLVGLRPDWLARADWCVSSRPLVPLSTSHLGTSAQLCNPAAKVPLCQLTSPRPPLLLPQVRAPASLRKRAQRRRRGLVRAGLPTTALLLGGGAGSLCEARSLESSRSPASRGGRLLHPSTPVPPLDHRGYWSRTFQRPGLHRRRRRQYGCYGRSSFIGRCFRAHHGSNQCAPEVQRRHPGPGDPVVGGRDRNHAHRHLPLS